MIAASPITESAAVGRTDRESPSRLDECRRTGEISANVERGQMRIARSIVVIAVAVGTLWVVPTVSSTRSCASWTSPIFPPTVGADNAPADVAATSACDAWAVGRYDDGGTGRTLILHWDGNDWSVVPSPNRGTGHNSLSGVAAISPTDAWAVGSWRSSADDRTLILHWDGVEWKAVKSPNAVTDSFNNLYEIAATSSRNAWAVGEYDDDGDYGALILRWNGTAWKVQSGPKVNGNAELFGVAASSPSDAWAVGYSETGTLALHWNGTAWKRSDSPSPGTGPAFEAATMVSGVLWAVGTYSNGTYDQPLIARWNGTAWKRQKPAPFGDGAALEDVSAATTTRIWVVGNSLTGPLIQFWDGTAWRRQTAPDPGVGAYLTGVSFVPRDGAWAVGTYGDGGQPRNPFILHCC
jgi:hypothetical protein